MVLTARILDPVTLTPISSHVMDFKLHILDSDAYCAGDSVSLEQGPDPSTYTYYVGDPSLDISGTFSQEIEYCELNWSLTQSDYNQG